MTKCPKCGAPVVAMQSMVADKKYRCIDARCRAAFFVDENDRVDAVVFGTKPDPAKTQCEIPGL
jgi:hypothetical protein